MYIPPYFEQPSVAIMQQLMHDYPFALLVVANDKGQVDLHHLPSALDPCSGRLGTLFLHIASSNPLATRLEPHQLVTVVFTGPHAYISPDWYETAGKVPTWNFMVVHAHGYVDTMNDEDAKTALEYLTAASERKLSKAPWTAEGLESSSYANLRKGVVAFSVEIEQLEGKWKVGQNHAMHDRLSAAAGLTRIGGSARTEVAKAMVASAEAEALDASDNKGKN